MNLESPLTVLDLFSGCGGLSLGFIQAGYDVVAAVDNWKDAIDTFNYNHPKSTGIVLDLASFDSKALAEKFGKVDVIVGGPPCQGFSISGKRDPNDPRNQLYLGFVDLVAHIQPKAFVMENVPNLVAMDRGSIKDRIISDFENLGYKMSYKILLASDFGVPQNRRRVVFVGMKHGFFTFPTGSHISPQSKNTTEDAISDLPECSLIDGTSYPMAALSDYQIKIRGESQKVYNHKITNHDLKTISIIALVPDGGNYKSLPEELRQTRKVNIAWTRYASTKPSLTIDTGHRHHFHYKYNRIPTVRESARLQSFPDDFIFIGSKTSQYKQVGNAVPPILAKAIAVELMKFLH